MGDFPSDGFRIGTMEIMRLVSQAPRVCGGFGLIGALLFQTGEASVRSEKHVHSLTVQSQPDGITSELMTASVSPFRYIEISLSRQKEGNGEAISQRPKRIMETTGPEILNSAG